MGVDGYATPLTVSYLGSDVSLLSGFNRHSIMTFTALHEWVGLVSSIEQTIVACRPAAEYWLCKQRPLLDIRRNRWCSLRDPCISYVMQK
jgi:hypothetical protein